MKKLKMFLRSKKTRKGMQGAISLFLCVLLIPFVQIGMVLAQTSQYYAALAVLDEAMGVSMNATLAHYDNYLQSRFGVYAMEQAGDTQAHIGGLFEHYINQNADILGSTLALSQTLSDANNPLSDFSILRKQLLEFNKLHAPVTLTAELLNIQELIAKLEKLGNFGSIMGMLTKGLNAAIAMKEAYEYLEKAKTHAENLEASGAGSLQGNYDNAYSELKAAVSNLCAALPDENEPKASDYGSIAAYEQALEAYRNDDTLAIYALRSKVMEKKTAYGNAIEAICDELAAHRDAVKGFLGKLDTIRSEAAGFAADVAMLATLDQEINQYQDNIKANRERLAEIQQKESEIGALNDAEALERQMLETAVLEDIDNLSESKQKREEINIATSTSDKLQTGMSDMMRNFNDHMANSVILAFSQEKEYVDAIDPYDNALGELDDATYHSVALGGHITVSDIVDYFNEQKAQLLEGSFTALLDAVNNFINKVFQMETFYTGAYSANIDTAFYEALGGLPGGDAADNPLLNLIMNIFAIIGNAVALPGNLLSMNIIGAINNIIDLITSIIDLFHSILAVIADMVENIIDLFSGVEKLYLSAYNAYNMPCRTDGRAKMTSMTPDLPSQPFYTGIPFGLGELAAFVDTLLSVFSGTGDDLAFSRAELEYTIIGSNHEIVNQAFVFLELYFMRLLLDALPVFTNKEVVTVASGAGALAPVVYVVIYFAEALADVLLLVNNSNAPLIKTRVHLTPSGIGPFIAKFLNGNLLGTEAMNQITTSISVEAFGYVGMAAESNDGILQMSYRDHCFLLLLLTVPNTRQTARIANLMQMEGSNHYGQDSGFRLANAYTNIHARTDVKVKQFLPSLLPENLFTSSRTQYRGY